MSYIVYGIEFFIFLKRETNRKKERKREAFSGLGPIFGTQQVIQEQDFFETMNLLKMSVPFRREHYFCELGVPRDGKKGDPKHENKSKSLDAKK